MDIISSGTSIPEINSCAQPLSPKILAPPPSPSPASTSEDDPGTKAEALSIQNENTSQHRLRSPPLPLYPRAQGVVRARTRGSSNSSNHAVSIFPFGRLSSHFTPPTTPSSSLPSPSPLFGDTPSLRDLHAERAYLTVSLQRQDDRAKRLLAGLNHVEERQRLASSSSAIGSMSGGSNSSWQQAALPGGSSSSNSNSTGNSRSSKAAELRKLHKETGRIKVKIAETERQERMILLRLSELYVDIQSRERWSLAQQQLQNRIQTTGLFSPAAMPFPPTTLPEPSESLLNPVSPFCLSPLSPVFVPGVKFSETCWGKKDGEAPEVVDGETAPEGNWKGTHSEDGIAPDEQVATCELPTTNDTSRVTLSSQLFQYEYVGVRDKEEDGDSNLSSHNGHEDGCGDWEDEDDLRGEGARYGSSKGRFVLSLDSRNGHHTGHMRGTSLGGLRLTYSPRPHDRRMSLPSLRSIWPGEA